MSHEQVKDAQLTNIKYLQIMWEDRDCTDLISNTYAKKRGIEKQIPVLAVEDVWQTLGVMFAKYMENLPQIHRH